MKKHLLFILIALSLLGFSQSTVTYYFNGYNTSNPGSWDSNPANVVDGSTSTLGADNENGDYLYLNSNTCSGTNLGTITKVELRAYHQNNWTSSQTTSNVVPRLIPYFNGATAGGNYNDAVGNYSTAAYGSSFNITLDGSAPGTWSWSDVQNLDCRLETYRPNSGNLSVYRVEIIVTYTSSAPANDLCTNATALPCGTTSLAGTTVNTTSNTDPSGCASAYGVWYTFTGDGNETTISSTAVFDHEMVIFSGSCGSLTNITCRDVALSGGTETYTFTTTVGLDYYVYIANWSTSSTTTGTFTISRSCVVLSPMTYVSSTTTQTNTSNVGVNSTSNEIVGLQVVTTGAGSPLSATSFTFNTTGSTAPATDITNGKLWSTGTSSTFATTTQVGTVVANPNGTFSFTGSVTLSEGTNYFWLTYDIPTGGVIGDVVDAQCTSVTVGGTARTPTVTNPAGNRPIDMVYCDVSGSSSSYYIDNFATTGGATNITNNASGFSSGGYGDFTAQTVTQTIGGSVNYSASFGSSSSYTFGFGVWVDWNQDGDFDDANEEIYVSSSYASIYSGSITVPTGASTGSTRMRIVAEYLDSSPEACGVTSSGEGEDYTFIVNAGTPMAFSSCTTTQPNTSDVHRNSTNQEVVCVQIVTSGYSSALSATSFSFNTTGTTAPSTDITNARLWSTGTSGTFTTTTQIGSVVAAPSGAFTITGTSTLSNGTNYFWLTYDVPSGATINNYIDAQCTSVTVSSVAHTPSTTNPTGNRKIIDALTWDGTFESATDLSGNGFTSANGTPNYWIVGTAINNGGSRCAYITNDGSSNAYSIGTSTYSHLYFDYTFPAGQTVISINFDWHCEGEGTTSDYDNLKVYVEPTSVTPVAGTTNSSTYLVGDTWYNFSSGWLSESISLNGAYAGTTKRIVFQWKNDASSGTQPPIAIDNITISSSVPTIPPNCATNLSPSDGSSNLCVNTELSWDSPTTGQAAEGYYLNLGTDNPPTNIENHLDLGTDQSYYTVLSPATTYYWQIIPYNAAGNASSCTVYSFTTNTSDVSANDEPCNAEFIAIGSSASGNNQCSNDANEPSSVPSCWTTGTRNTLWYTFTAPVSGSVAISTILGTIASTQLAIYSGTCDNLTYVDCNQDAPTCDYSYQNSRFTVSGLTSGNTYYVVVDGENDDVGNFNITISDGSAGLPIVYGQDCGVDNAIPVCDSHFAVGDPGFQAIGNYCDFDGSNDCTSGERGAVWYHIQIGVDGVLDFTLVPNDWDGSDETDYDFLLYQMVGSSAVTCEEIANGTAAPVRCNYSYLGVTGMYSTSDGTAPAAYSGFGAAFEAQLDVLAGEEYFLVVQNFSNSTSGFDLDLGSSPITIPGGVPTSLTWTGGGNSTSWYDPMNWGDCAYYPDENIDANVIASSVYQPVIDVVDPNNGDNARVKSLTISGGSNLTIDPTQTFEVYGDYTNSGILNASPGSTVIWMGSGVQTLDGSLQGASAFDNFTVTKSSGSVLTNQDIEVTGDFTTTNSTSVFNLNDLKLTLGGDFNNASGSTSFTGITNSTLVFNGNAAQAYSPGSVMTWHNVTMNNSGAGLNLNSDIRINTAGTITFTNGIIHTSTYKLEVLNTSGSAITQGNYSSYINGNLRAYIANNTNLYHFPVGVSNRYALADLQNHNLSGSSYLDIHFYSSFNNFGSLDPTRAIDFGTPYVSVSTEGMWEIIPNAQPSGGSYDIFLTVDDGQGFDGLGIPIGNAFTGLADNQFGLLKRNHTSDLASEWYGESIGSLNANGGAGRMLSDGYASRYGISSFSDFAIGIGDFPLPIELIDFRVDCNSQAKSISWQVASEVSLKEYVIEKSIDAKNYKEIEVIQPDFYQAYPKKYQVRDEQFDASVEYYRLKELDLDGKQTIYNVKSCQCSKDDLSYFVKSYQTEQDEIQVETIIPIGEYTVKLYDQLGRVVLVQKINQVSHASQVLGLNAHLSQGIYIVSIYNANNYFVSKLNIE
ncbi:MAG: T9SS type A sorting domain-containing protein [Bacteroidales bacterium]|nr:T9SS type A sorting domain-containing protein [Bacteroidales bacterium]